MRKYMVLIIGLFILGAINVSIWHKEQLLANGKTVFLALAPVDPRSLMQAAGKRLKWRVAPSCCLRQARSVRLF